MRKYLVTGVAGFIGFHLAQRLLKEGNDVIGLDNLNNYYSISLKQDRLNILKKGHQDRFQFYCLDLKDSNSINKLFIQYNFDVVIHLAAQAGVRYSITNPLTYIDSNILGFTNILEACKNSNIQHFIFASSSSVYGANTKIPFSVNDNVDYPVSLYAATKKANELIAHNYSHLYKIPVTGIRFFTVYGPWGRPDMAYFKFTKSIIENTPIQIFNEGKMIRDFTYVDDVIEGIFRLIYKIPQPINSDYTTSNALYKIYNLGNNQPVNLLHFIQILENHLGIKSIKNLLPMQPGDVETTFADISDLTIDTGFKPSTSIEVGLKYFVDWYRNYYQV